jgi:hypothetical protein
VKQRNSPPHWWQYSPADWQMYGIKRRGISRIGYLSPAGTVEWEPTRWPAAFVSRAIAMLKAARPLR